MTDKQELGKMKEILKENDYVFYVNRLDDSGFKFCPPDREIHPVFYNFTLTIQPDEQEEKIWVKVGNSEAQEIYCPRYAIRPYMLAELLTILNDIVYHPPFVEYIDENGNILEQKHAWQTCLPFKLTDQELKQETILWSWVVGSITSKDVVASIEKYDIKDGFNIVNSVISGEQNESL